MISYDLLTAFFEKGETYRIPTNFYQFELVACRSGRGRATGAVGQEPSDRSRPAGAVRSEAFGRCRSAVRPSRLAENVEKKRPKYAALPPGNDSTWSLLDLTQHAARTAGASSDSLSRVALAQLVGWVVWRSANFSMVFFALA